MDRSRRTVRWRSVIGTLALLAVVTTDSPPALAQDATSVVGSMDAGTCDALGERRHELTAVDIGAGVGGERVGSERAEAMTYSITDLDVPFDDLLAAPHAVVVRANPDDPASVVACGEIGGFVEDDSLAVGLKRPDGVGLAGMAFLWDDDDAVEVELYLPQAIGSAA